MNNKDLNEQLKHRDKYIELLKQRIGELLDEIHALRTDLDNKILLEDEDEEPKIKAGSLWEDQYEDEVYLLVQYGDTWMTFNVETGRLYSTGSTPEEATEAEDLRFIDNTYEVIIYNDR